MKAIMKKVPKFVGINMSLQELLDYSEGNELYVDDNCWEYLSDQKVTIKLKNKIIDIKDISISLEENKD